MPKKIQDFARSALVNPVTVNVGRARAANPKLTQEIEWVRPDGRMTRLLAVLQKTAPPVLIFAEKKHDVDAIHEYLLLHAVEAVAIHGGKEQVERASAVGEFRAGQRDVLVATDVASKGLDFKDIKHVINYDMPNDIENYVHRVGRTGRQGKSGLATTFVYSHLEESLLLDLKHLLIEAKQEIPESLANIRSEDDQFVLVGGDRGCSYCGGLGHRITACPKLLATQNKQASGRTDFMKSGTGDW